MAMPATATAGDTFTATMSAAAASPSSGWSVQKMRLVPRTPGNEVVELVGTSDGDAAVFNASAASTSGWIADTYTWYHLAERGADATTLASGTLVLRPDPRTVASGYDGRSETERALEDARAALRTFNPARKKYQIGSRTMEFASAADIIVKIKHLELELRNERAALGIEPARQRIYRTRL